LYLSPPLPFALCLLCLFLGYLLSAICYLLPAFRLMSLPLVYNPDYVTPLPEGHRFPMPKFGKVYETLIRDGVATLDQFHFAEMADRDLLTLAHSPAYVDAYLTGAIDPKLMRRIGFPWSPQLVKRTCTALGGTVLAAQLAMEHGLACNTAGGTHHAYPDFGSGFCIFNDIAVAARYAQATGLAERILIVDLDVHQGDGSAFIFQDDPLVFTFSIHCEKNFPFRKQRSTLDVPLAIGVEDEEYLAVLQRYLPAILDDFAPDLVFYDGGVDPHREDALGKLSLTDAGLYARDLYVFTQCAGREIPVVAVIGGGYQADVERLGRRHTLIHRAASTTFEQFYA
jgi:acetoin utilization deacetylase AcuC-like enzyme